MQFAPVAETNQIVKSDDLQSRNEVNQSNFFSFNFLNKYGKSTALLLI